MKRDFLKNLGIEDKEVIDKILDENSADIGRAKGELQTYKDKVTELEGQVADLKPKAERVDSLEQENNQLKTDKTNLTNELNTKVAKIQKDQAVESAVRDAKARSVKAVLAHLDMEKITHENGELSGLTEQLEALKTGEDTSFLFGEVKQSAPSGTHNSTPNSNGGTPPTSKTFAEAVAKSLNKTN